jgi:peptidoglycan/xylan/chitin deacetylase (PgdA/CDA1 family)
VRLKDIVEAKKYSYILTFHGIGTPERCLEKGEANFWVNPSLFEAILDAVGYRPDVQVTFDDSNSSDFRIAFPALIRRRMQAAFFVVSGRIGIPGFLTAEQIRELVRSGMTIGSHGTQHRHWARLSPPELRDELNASRTALESLIDQAVREAACPFGSYNRRVLQGLHAAGYAKVYTSDDGPALRGDWVLARNTIESRHNLQHVENLVQSAPKALFAFSRKLKQTLKRLR